jgi:hypothetical protein
VTAVSDRQAAFHGWAFLVARGRRKGYRSLLVPDFLAESNEYGVLSQMTGADAPVGGAPTIARVHGLAAGDVVLTYQTQRLTYGDVGISSDHRPEEPLTDEFGRPLDLLYGFVCRAAGLSTVDDADFLTARAEAIRTYQRFLADESGFELETSKPFVLRSVPSPTEPVPSPVSSSSGDAQPAPLAEPAATPTDEPAPMPAHFAEPAPAPAHFAEPVPAGSATHSPAARRKAVLAGLLVVALSATVWLVVLRGRGGPVTEVDITGPGSSTVDCTSSITVEGTIRTKTEATVVYHWESTIAAGSTSGTLTFTQAAAQSVQTTLQLNGSSGDPIEFTATLVVDKPNSKKKSRDYTLTCK